MTELQALEDSITSGDFAKVADFFYRKTGIRFDERRRYFVAKRIARRIHETGSPGFRIWFNAMRFEAAQTEFQNLVNAMTVNETYFYREEHQLDALAGPVLDEVAQARPGELLRIWSVPCSTGEEPYSIALKLIEDWPAIDRVDVKILASDIDTQVLAAAEAGIYSRRSVAQLPPGVLARHFRPSGPHHHALSREVVNCVERSRLNITDPDLARLMPSVDVIFCRNLLIYFDDTSRRLAVEGLYDVLRPGGFVFLGHSESMSRMSSLFRVRKFGSVIVYQKP